MTVADDRAVGAVLVTYARALDTKDWTLFRSLFTDDAVFDVAGTLIEGADLLTRHMAELHDPLDGSRHHVGNAVVDVDGATALASSYVDALLVRRRHSDGPTVRVTGSYHDELVLHDGRWLIHRRRFELLWSEGNTALLRSG
jgi:uncharacterized protein (TIGR02246 family)